MESKCNAEEKATWSGLFNSTQWKTAKQSTGLPGLVTGAHSQQGRKPGNPEYANQDRYLEMRFGRGQLLLGVFDGHGPAGHVVSQRTKEICASMAPSIAEAKDTGSAFLQAFAQCASEIEREEGSYENGATVTLVLIDPSSRTASIAHVGDSAAMIVRPGGAIAFQTKDHKADAEGERQRLEDHGSYIHKGRLCLTSRTGSSLALSRSIGDLAYRQRGLIAEPEIACGLPFEPGSVMILASDGIWDMVTKEEVASAALQTSPQAAVESLIAVAHFRWLAQSHVDDITAIVVKSAAAPFQLQASQSNSLWLHGPKTAEAPLAHCPSNALYCSDKQEELNLHPSLANLKKNAPFEADAASILTGAMGGVMNTGVAEDWAQRTVRQQNPLQKTESQLVMAQAQMLGLKEQRRRQDAAAAAATATKPPSPIRAILANRPYRQKIYLMRHGESEANISRRDVPDPNLTHLGHAQAKSWQESIGDFQADIVLVSPLRRAVMTACHAFSYEEVPMVFCRFAREIGWSCNENTIHSTPASMEKLLDSLTRGDEIVGVKEALIAGPDDPPDEMASLQRLKIAIASRTEHNIVVVCHFGVIAALTGCRAKNGDIYECEWGYNDELNTIQRHKTPISDQQCICG